MRLACVPSVNALFGEEGDTVQKKAFASADFIKQVKAGTRNYKSLADAITKYFLGPANSSPLIPNL